MSDGQICKLPVAVLDQILKRGAAAWVVGAVPSPVLEGDYATWTQKWISDALAITGGIFIGAINVDDNRVFINDTHRYLVILDLSDGTIISEESFLALGGNAQTLASSVLGKYQVVIESATKLRVYKDGSLEQTIEVAGRDWWGVLISPDGQYIVAFDDNDDKVYCFEGS